MMSDLSQIIFTALVIASMSGHISPTEESEKNKLQAISQHESAYNEWQQSGQMTDDMNKSCNLGINFSADSSWSKNQSCIPKDR